MTPLLKPNSSPAPGALTRQLGMGATFFSANREQFRDRVAHVLRIIEPFLDVQAKMVESHVGDDGRSEDLVYEFEYGEECHGSATLMYLQRPHVLNNSGILARINWTALGANMDAIVGVCDSLWCVSQCDTFYVYDEDDFRIQNADAVIGMHFYGIERSQVEIVRKGITECIKVSNNPGYSVYRQGLQLSMQWLTYWSLNAQHTFLGESRIQTNPPAEVKSADERGGVRIRLGHRPGRYDDVAFHELQLVCRKRLSLA